MMKVIRELIAKFAMKKGIVLPFLLLLASVTLILGAFFIIDNKQNWKTYTNKGVGYSIKHPGFNLDESSGFTVLHQWEKPNPPGSSSDPYPGPKIAIYEISNPKYQNARDACNAYLCNNLSDSAVGFWWKIEEVKIVDGTGVKIYDIDQPLHTFLYLHSNKTNKTVFVHMGVEFWGLPTDNRPDDDKFKDLSMLNQILSTFRFVE